MQCLKCGREIDDSLSFCDGCRAQMEKYPVRPDAIVQIPKRTVSQKRAGRKQKTFTEEDARRLWKQNLILTVLSGIMTVIVVVQTRVFVSHLRNDHIKFDGKNYTVVNTIPTESDVSRETTETRNP